MTPNSQWFSWWRRHPAVTAGGLTLLFVASRVAVFAWLAGVGTDLDVQERYGRLIVQGRVPFRDFSSEYPPLALAFAALPALVDPAGHHYATIFRCLCCAADVAVWAALLQVNRSRPGRNLLYVCCTTALGPILYDRHDIVLGAIVLLTARAVAQGRPRVAAAAAGVGIAFKLVPVVWVPLFVAWAWARRHRWADVWAIATWLLAPSAVSIGVVLAAGGTGIGGLARYHLGRGVQIESLPATVEFVWMRLGDPGFVAPGSGSWNVEAGHADDVALVAALLGGKVVLAAALWVGTGRRTPAAVGLMATAVLTLAVGLSKVLSPQYILFLLPLLVTSPSVTPLWRDAAYGAAVLAVAAITGLVYPWFYDRLVRLQLGWEVALAARNMALVALGAGFAVRAWPDAGSVRNARP